MEFGTGINQAYLSAFQKSQAQAAALRIQSTQLACGANVLDFGVHTYGGLEAGVHLASICMAGQANISIVTGDRLVWAGPWIQVATDHPVEACMLAQYAGWPVKQGDFFAMGSGAMRVRRGREELLQSLAACDAQPLAVGTLECDQLPNCEVAREMAEQCSVQPSELYLAVAPTRSIAGCVQVVARSVETSMHKLHELGFPLDRVRSAYGIAPVPPPTPDFGKGIGRTNDAMLYGAHVTLWLEADDDQLVEITRQLPSCASRDFGAPFAEIFKRYEYDFYKVDPGLFSPAHVVIVNLKSGNSWSAGALQTELIAKSFGTKAASALSSNL